VSQRSTWQFTFTCQKVAAAAAAKAAHHRAREQFWTAQHAKAEEDLKTKGVQMREQPITGGNRIEAVLDPGLAARVNECGVKRDKHREQAEEYEAFQRALELNAEHEVRLDVQDITWFGL
jgi:hypothetical protein